MEQATRVESVFDMMPQLALCVALGHKNTLVSIIALHIHKQHSHYKLTRGVVLNFFLYIASSTAIYFFLYAHETLLLFSVTDMLNLRFSLKIYIYLKICTDFLIMYLYG